MLTANLPMIGPVCDLREIVLTYSGRSPGEPSLRRRLGESPHYVWRTSHESPNPRIRGRSTALSQRTRGRSTALSRRTRGRSTALLPRSPVLPRPCACPPALAASTRAMCMSSRARRFCLGCAHIYLGHAHVRLHSPGLPGPRACLSGPRACPPRSAPESPRPIMSTSAGHMADHVRVGRLTEADGIRHRSFLAGPPGAPRERHPPSPVRPGDMYPTVVALPAEFEYAHVHFPVAGSFSGNICCSPSGAGACRIPDPERNAESLPPVTPAVEMSGGAAGFRSSGSEVIRGGVRS